MIDLKSIDLIGSNLNRPECVLCTSNGRVYVSNTDGGITIIEPDGAQIDHVATGGDFDLFPNGFCLMADGSVLLAHLGAQKGGVFRLREDGALEPFLTEIDGRELPPTNYVHLDTLGRIWVTVSTSVTPRARAYRPEVADGYIILIDGGGARVVADGLGYTNECVVYPDGRRLLVNETFARRLTRFDITSGGDLINRTTLARFGHGTYPDGLTLDAEGGMWITSIVSNRVICLSPDGAEQTILIEDNNPDHVQRAEAAYLAGEMGRPHLDRIESKKLKNISSLAFGGPGLSQIRLGCLLGQAIYTCPSPIRGQPPAHWDFPGPQIL